MRMSIKPASMLLVGILFICVLCDLASSEQSSNGLNPFDKFEGRSLYSLHREASSGWGELKVGEDSVYFPWHRSSSRVSLPLSSPVSSDTSSVESEEFSMEGNDTAATVGDLSAMNSQMQRTISYKDSQNGDPNYLGLANSLDISVSGSRADESGAGFSKAIPDILETSASESAVSNEEFNESDGQMDDIGDLNHLGNYLSVDVHGIYVSAANTVPGGSAVATSNIIIEPVQIILCPSEIEEKLR